MSFFERKIITTKIRNRRIKFYAVSQTKLIEAQKSFKYYGKLEGEDLGNPELLLRATEELIAFIHSKIVSDEEEEKPTLDDLADLTTSELQEVFKEMTSIVEIKQLNASK